MVFKKKFIGNYFITLIITTFVISCKSGGDSSFPENIHLKSQSINLSDDFIVKSGVIRICKDFIINHDGYSQNKLFTVFDKKNFRKLYEFAALGKGPDEISISGFFTTRKNYNYLWLYDAGKLEIVKYILSDSLSKVKVLNKTSVSSDIAPLMNFMNVGNDSFVSQNFKSPEEFSFVYLDSSDSISFFGNAYQTEDPIILNDYYNQYYFFPNANYEKSLFVRAFVHYDVIQIIDSSGNLRNEYKGENFELLSGSNPLTHYRGIRITDDFIYAEYVGKSHFDRERNVPNYSKQIRIFDWELKPVAILNLDVPIVSFDIDVKNKRLVAYIEDEKNPLVYFKFDEDRL